MQLSVRCAKVMPEDDGISELPGTVRWGMRFHFTGAETCQGQVREPCDWSRSHSRVGGLRVDRATAYKEQRRRTADALGCGHDGEKKKTDEGFPDSVKCWASAKCWSQFWSQNTHTHIIITLLHYSVVDLYDN